MFYMYDHVCYHIMGIIDDDWSVLNHVAWQRRKDFQLWQTVSGPDLDKVKRMKFACRFSGSDDDQSDAVLKDNYINLYNTF